MVREGKGDWAVRKASEAPAEKVAMPPKRNRERTSGGGSGPSPGKVRSRTPTDAAKQMDATPARNAGSQGPLGGASQGNSSGAVEVPTTASATVQPSPPIASSPAFLATAAKTARDSSVT